MKTTEIPIRFPKDVDVIRDEAAAFRRLSEPERFRIVFDMMALASKMVATSPNREKVEKLIESQEREWQRAHRELFARHGF
jgi:hypothetical protein